MKVQLTPNSTILKVGISESRKQNRRIPFLFNVVKNEIVDKHGLPASYNNSSRGYIVLPRVTREILSELNKCGIQYRAKVI